MSLQFDPLDAYYVVGDHNPTTEVFSTASSVEAYVANNAVAYLAWLTAGNFNFYTTIVSSADNGSGLIRLTLTDGSSLATGQRWRVNGSASYDGNYQITKISTNVVDLVGSTYTGDSVENANLQGAAIVATEAELWLNFDNYARNSWPGGSSSTSSSVDIVIAAPLPNYIEVSMSATGKKIILPKSRSPRSVPKGDNFVVRNSGSIEFDIYAQDGSTAVAQGVRARESITLAVTDNTTPNGSTAVVTRRDGNTAAYVLGLSGGLSSGTNSQFTFTSCSMRDAFGFGKYFNSPSTFQIDTATAGPAVSGRDQAGAFGSTAEISYWAIWGPGLSVAGTVSLASPGQTPTLPTGYTHFCYLCSVKFVASAMPVFVVTGDIVTLMDAATYSQFLTSGAATGATGAAFPAVIPAFARNIQMQIDGYTSGSNVLTIYLRSSVAFDTFTLGGAGWCGSSVLVPVGFSHLEYKWGSAGGSLNLRVLGFTVPNGG